MVVGNKTAVIDQVRITVSPFTQTTLFHPAGIAISLRFFDPSVKTAHNVEEAFYSLAHAANKDVEGVPWGSSLPECRIEPRVNRPDRRVRPMVSRQTMRLLVVISFIVIVI